MTDIDNLSDAQTGSGGTDALTAADQLTALFDLPTGLSVRGARMVGRGSRASADVFLSDGTTVTFDSLREMANPTRLSLEIAACTGATPRLKPPQAIRAVSLLRTIAERHAAFTADEIAFDWGTDYLQSADVLDVDMTDQHYRWRVFSHLANVHPIARARESGGPIAAATIVLRHTDNMRFVRTGWFREVVRGQDPSISPQELAHRMERVGWSRRGTTGRIKACQPLGPRRLGWSFYTVPPNWEDTT